MINILLLNGPNLNLLGTREPALYGKTTLNDIVKQLTQQASVQGYLLTCFQSNAEHELINHIHQAKANQVKFIIINPGALTHTSIALRDALLGVDIPFIEVHLSNIKKREPFRHQSFLEDIALGVIFGFGAYGYELALMASHHYLSNTNEER